MGAGEPGMLSPSPPTHGPLARAAELRWTSATRWVKNGVSLNLRTASP